MAMSLSNIKSLTECCFGIGHCDDVIAANVVTKDFWDANQLLNDDGMLDYTLFPMFAELMEAVYEITLPNGNTAMAGDEAATIAYLTSLGLEYKSELNDLCDEDCGDCEEDDCTCGLEPIVYVERSLDVDSYLD